MQVEKSFNMKRALWISACVVLILCTACGRKSESSSSVKMVKIDTIKYFGLTEKSQFPGKVKASEDVNLAFRTSGTILKINVKEGQAVKKDYVLAEMDSRDYKVQLDATTAEYERIKGEAERVIALYNEQSVSKNEYEKALYGLRQAEAMLEAAQNAYNDTKLKAPFDGYVEKRLFDENETISAGMPVISMISNALPEVEINIPAADYARVGEMEGFYCRFDLFPDKSFPLELVGVNRKANLNQLYKMTLRLKNREGEMSLTPGMTTMVTIEYRPETTATEANAGTASQRATSATTGTSAGSPEATSSKTTLPTTAIIHKEGATFVWVYDPAEECIHAVDVTVESIHRDGYSVLCEGPSAGSLVISAGGNSLKEGEKVKPLAPQSVTNIGGVL